MCATESLTPSRHSCTKLRQASGASLGHSSTSMLPRDVTRRTCGDIHETSRHCLASSSGARARAAGGGQRCSSDRLLTLPLVGGSATEVDEAIAARPPGAPRQTAAVRPRFVEVGADSAGSGRQSRAPRLNTSLAHNASPGHSLRQSLGRESQSIRTERPCRLQQWRALQAPPLASAKCRSSICGL